jgi:quercetin dioxygenase-like cupin family protein
MPNDASLDGWAALSETLDPVTPSASARSRLLTAIEGPLRYLPFTGELANHFALSREEARALLARLDDADAWTPGVQPVMGSLHFRPGPSATPLRAGIVRMNEGSGFPLHRHRDREVTLVLEGRLVDDQGIQYGPGEALEMPEGSQHTVHVLEGPAVLALLHGKIEMLGA